MCTFPEKLAPLFPLLQGPLKPSSLAPISSPRSQSTITPCNRHITISFLTQKHHIAFQQAGVVAGWAGDMGAVPRRRKALTARPLLQQSDHDLPQAQSCCRRADSPRCTAVLSSCDSDLYVTVCLHHSPASPEKTSSLDLEGEPKSPLGQILCLVPPTSGEAYLPSILVNLQKS